MLRLRNAFLIFLSLIVAQMFAVAFALQFGTMFLIPFVLVLSFTGALIFVTTAYSVFFGAPFVPTDKRNVDDMISIAQIKPGDKMVDLGAGDGRIVIAAAKQGAQAEGYEISPFLWLLANWNIKKEGLEKQAKVHLSSYWAHDLSDMDVVTMFLIDHYMPRMHKKLHNELRKGSRVVSYAFQFPNWEHEDKNGKGVYLYRT